MIIVAIIVLGVITWVTRNVLYVFSKIVEETYEKDNNNESINILKKQKEYSYSEQEVINMLEALRQRCAESYSKGFTFKSDKECILKVNYSDLLKK